MGAMEETSTKQQKPRNVNTEKSVTWKPGESNQGMQNDNVEPQN